MATAANPVLARHHVVDEATGAFVGIVRKYGPREWVAVLIDLEGFKAVDTSAPHPTLAKASAWLLTHRRRNRGQA